MHLYNLSIVKGNAAVDAVFGSFSTSKAQEVVLAGTTSVTLLRHDVNADVMVEVAHVPLFATVRCVKPFRLTGADTDYLVLGTDSGKIAILHFDNDLNTFVKVQCETFGKTGCRRIVPGQMLAVDPNGRAVMIGATEKQKFVYILTRDASANLIISSPLEAHKSHTLVYSMCGIDVMFENPLFACIESPYDQVDDNGIAPKMLTYYELDLGLNHVTRSHTLQIDHGANDLVSVPGGTDGPGGVLILCENKVLWHSLAAGAEVRSAPLPRRVGQKEGEPLMLVAHASHRQKGFFFFLVQSEYGDLYKVSLSFDASMVHDIHVRYFDTVPLAKSLCLLQTGFIFVAAEFGNHYLLQFRSLGDDEAEPIETSTETSQEVVFAPRKLQNLAMVDDLPSLSPILQMKIADLAQENSCQIYAFCGRGHRSSLRVLRHGLAVLEMAVSDVPATPVAVWSVKRRRSDEFDRFIVVSYTNATLVLSIGDTVEEVSDSGLLGSAQTLFVGVLGDATWVQVHPHGVRVIAGDDRVSEWQPPGKKTIVQCAVNAAQVVIAMTGGEIVYFEADDSGALQEIDRKEMRNDVCSLALSEVPEGRRRASFLAVGCFDNTVLLLAVHDVNEPLRQLTIQAVGAQPHSLLIAALHSSAGLRDRDAHQTFLFVGLANGVLIRSLIDESTSALTDTRKRFLGSKPVRVFPAFADGTAAVLAVSSRSWLCHSQRGRVLTLPLSYDALDFASAFSSAQCSEGIVALAGSTLRILTVPKFGEPFNASVAKLLYTPRKMVLHPGSNLAIVLEADHRSYSPSTQIKQLPDQARFDYSAAEKIGGGGGADVDDEDESEDEAEDDFRMPLRAPVGQWSSCVRLIDPVSLKTLSLLHLDDNEAAFSAATVEFSEKGSEVFLAIGTAKDLVLKPRSCSAAFIRVYRFTKKSTLELIYKTPVEDVPLALLAFQGRLLAGVGNTLRIYDMGKRKLLRKSENKNFPTSIVSLRSQGDRIYVGDMCESVHLVRYRRAEKQLEIFADTTEPRYLTAMEVLDYNTVAGADKFGNFFVSRLPDEIASVDEEDAVPFSASEIMLYGAPHKMKTLVNFHLVDLVTALQKVSMVPGAQEALFYATIGGAIGVFLPFSSREDIDFFSHLEMHLRQHAAPVSGRDHMALRSAYWPVKDCIDGDLCETFATLPFDTQNTIAEQMGFSAADIAKKVEELRNRFL